MSSHHPLPSHSAHSAHSHSVYSHRSAIPPPQGQAPPPPSQPLAGPPSQLNNQPVPPPPPPPSTSAPTASATAPSASLSTVATLNQQQPQQHPQQQQQQQQQTQQPPNHRFAELLDCVKQEFEHLQSESHHLKSQSSEFETHVGVCVSDLGQLREQYYQLDREHQKLKLRYEEELRRLHLELDQRNSASGVGPAGPINHELRGPPNLPSNSLPSGSNSFGGIVNSGPTSTSTPSHQQLAGSNNSSGPANPIPLHHENHFASQAPQARGEPGNFSNGSHHRGDSVINDPPPVHPSKRHRSDRDSHDPSVEMVVGGRGSHSQPSGPPINLTSQSGRIASPPVMANSSSRVPDAKSKLKPSGEGPYSSKLSASSNANSHPYGGSSSYHPRGEGHPLPPPSSHHFSSNSTVPAPSPNNNPSSATSSTGPNQQQPPASSNGNVLLDIDPDSLPSTMKKEGVDWITVFNPRIKKVLDVGLVHTLIHESVVCCVKFSPDGKTLATGCNRHTTLYCTRTGSKTGFLVDEATAGSTADNYIRSACFSPDGHLLATGSEDRMIRIWDLETKKIHSRFPGHQSEIYSLAFSPDGRILVSGSGDRTARIWDVNQNTCLFSLVIEEAFTAENNLVDAGVTSVCVSPDSSILATGSLDTVVRLWDSKTGQILDKLRGHKDSVYSVAFSPDGKFLVSGSLDRTLKLWDLSSLNREHHSNNAVGVAGGGSGGGGGGGLGSMIKREDLSGNGPGVGRDDRAADLQGKVTSDRGFDGSRSSTVCTTTLSGHKDYVLSVAVSPDGQWIMSGSKDRGVQLWDSKSGHAQFMLQGHKNSVISIAVSDVGGLFATGSGDWHARIWSYEKI